MAQKSNTNDGVTSTGTPTGPTSDLDALDSLAAQVDADHTGTLPDGSAIADQPPPINYGQEAAATVDTFAALLTGYCPATLPLWGDDKKAAVAAALAPVMEKYGFTLGAMPCELVLIITAGPLLYQSSKIVAQQMASEKAKATPQKMHNDVTDSTGPLQKPTKTVETPEVLRHPQTALYPAP